MHVLTIVEVWCMCCPVLGAERVSARVLTLYATPRACMCKKS
jgi:hypothetical protein